MGGNLNLEVILQDGPAYRRLVQHAVSDGSVFEQCHRFLCKMTENSNARSIERAITVARHLGDRRFAQHLAELLLSSSTSEDGLPNWSFSALEFISEQLVPSSPVRRDVFRLAMSNEFTRPMGWRMIRAEDVDLFLPWVVSFLRETPDEATAVGLKFALVWQNYIPALAERLNEEEPLPEKALSDLCLALQTYLLRVRRIRIWREFSMKLSGR